MYYYAMTYKSYCRLLKSINHLFVLFSAIVSDVDPALKQYSAMFRERAVGVERIS